MGHKSLGFNTEQRLLYTRLGISNGIRNRFKFDRDEANS